MAQHHDGSARPVTFTFRRTGDGTQTSRYLYNALEQLVSRSTNAPGGPAGTVHYTYGLDGSLLAEADAATGATLRDYIWLPQGDASPAADNDNEEGASPPPLPLALVTGVATPAPSLLMVHADHLARPLRLTDTTRATVWSASYDPFGQRVSITGTLEQNLRFPGQYFLIETGLSYNWHRVYDPATGRYAQPDPLRFVDGPSVYAYAGQSPMMRVDPDGMQSLPLPIPVPVPIFPTPSKPRKPWDPGKTGPMPKSKGTGGFGGGDDDGYCDAVEESCYENFTVALDKCALPDRQSMNFPRCINQCMFDQGCGGQNYSDGWDNGKLGTPRSWLY